MTMVRGFIVSAWDEHRPDAPASRRILATGRLEDGRSFALVLPAPAPAVYVAAEDGPRAAALLAHTHRATLDPAGWSDLAGAALARVDLPEGAAEDAWQRLAAGGTRARRRSPSTVRSARSEGTLVTFGEPTGGPTKSTSPGPPAPARDTAVTAPARSVSMSRASHASAGTAAEGASSGFTKTRSTRRPGTGSPRRATGPVSPIASSASEARARSTCHTGVPPAASRCQASSAAPSGRSTRARAAPARSDQPAGSRVARWV